MTVSPQTEFVFADVDGDAPACGRRMGQNEGLAAQAQRHLAGEDNIRAQLTSARPDLRAPVQAGFAARDEQLRGTIRAQ
jgi:hypothetical protein